MLADDKPDEVTVTTFESLLRKLAKFDKTWKATIKAHRGLDIAR